MGTPLRVLQGSPVTAMGTTPTPPPPLAASDLAQRYNVSQTPLRFTWERGRAPARRMPHSPYRRPRRRSSAAAPAPRARPVQSPRPECPHSPRCAHDRSRAAAAGRDPLDLPAPPPRVRRRLLLPGRRVDWDVLVRDPFNGPGLIRGQPDPILARPHAFRDAVVLPHGQTDPVHPSAEPPLSPLVQTPLQLLAVAAGTVARARAADAVAAGRLAQLLVFDLQDVYDPRQLLEVGAQLVVLGA